MPRCGLAARFAQYPFADGKDEPAFGPEELPISPTLRKAPATVLGQNVELEDRGYLGVLLAPITQDMAEELKLESKRGALVTAVEKDGPAAQAGLKPGDVIVRVDDKPINDGAQLTRAVGQHQPGSKLNLVRWISPRNIKETFSPPTDYRYPFMAEE